MAYMQVMFSLGAREALLDPVPNSSIKHTSRSGGGALPLFEGRPVPTSFRHVSVSMEGIVPLQHKT